MVKLHQVGQAELLAVSMTRVRNQWVLEQWHKRKPEIVGMFDQEKVLKPTHRLRVQPVQMGSKTALVQEELDQALQLHTHFHYTLEPPDDFAIPMEQQGRWGSAV